jgi:hypothetical protein
MTANRLLFYASRDDPDRNRLAAVIDQVIPKKRAEFFRRFEDLRDRLRRPVEPDSIAVLVASDRAELLKMQGLRAWLAEVSVILVVPDGAADMITLSHRLLPRFLCRKDDDFEDLKKVLRKMSRTTR